MRTFKVLPEGKIRLPSFRKKDGNLLKEDGRGAKEGGRMTKRKRAADKKKPADCQNRPVGGENVNGRLGRLVDGDVDFEEAGGGADRVPGSVQGVGTEELVSAPGVFVPSEFRRAISRNVNIDLKGTFFIGRVGP